MINCLVICGPTASGKTRLGARVAARFDGEILSADSRQIFRGMDIGTGKDLDEYKNKGQAVACHLIDIADPEEIYSLWNYQRDFYAVFKKVRAAEKLPVVVGGTGLYIEAVLKNYAIPNVPEDVDLRRELMEQSKEKLLDRLKTLDLAILEKTDVSSKKRIARSVEVAIYAQDHEVEWGFLDAPKIEPLVIGIQLPRPELRERIRRRLEARLDAGMIEEVRGLIDRGISRERLNLFGMEYGWIGRFLAGEVSREVMIEELRLAICRLAKRQETWFRGMERRGISVTWIEGPDFETASRLIQARFEESPI